MRWLFRIACGVIPSMVQEEAGARCGLLFLALFFFFCMPNPEIT
jgi:hypothetical protein